MRKVYLTLAAAPLLAFTLQSANAQLRSTPSMISLVPAPPNYPFGFPQTILIDDINGAHVKFKYAGTKSIENIDAPGFIVVIPSSGETPATVQIGVNTNVTSLVPPSSRLNVLVTFATVGQITPSTTTTFVGFTVPSQSTPIIQSVVNSASLQPFLSPGALVSIFGSNLFPSTVSNTFDDTGSYPTSLAGTAVELNVELNGVAAPLLYMSPSQINAIVPFSLAGQTSVRVAVYRVGQSSNTFTVPIQDTAPAIFTSSQTGAGQAAVLQLTRNGPFYDAASYNSSSNPAHAGDYLEIFATGQGTWTQPPQSDVFFFGESFTAQPVSLTIGGQTAKIVYSGTLGGTLNSWSVLQVNAVVPDGVGSGAQPVVLKIGAHDNSQQKVTVAVQ